MAAKASRRGSSRCRIEVYLFSWGLGWQWKLLNLQTTHQWLCEETIIQFQTKLWGLHLTCKLHHREHFQNSEEN